MRFLFPIIFLFLISCKDEQVEPQPTPADTFIRGADLSFLPELDRRGMIFYNSNGTAENMLQTLKQNGVNTVRIRLWNNPATVHSSFSEVKTLAARVKALGMKVWLSLHYSDTWADPGHQVTPAAWQGLPFAVLKDSLYNFTRKVMQEINPEYIQPGNEINPGMMLPYGDISTNEPQFIDLLKTAGKAVRDQSSSTKIIIHYAGITATQWFFDKLRNVDYDIIGLSWYPIWHGKDMNDVKSTLTALYQTYNKPTMIAETAYPFTLQWNDWTNNLLGDNSQIIYPAYPATPEGQKNFITQLKAVCKSTSGCTGIAYWGGELVAFDGPTSANGSPWENQALYDFSNKVLPVITAFAP